MSTAPVFTTGRPDSPSASAHAPQNDDSALDEGSQHSLPIPPSTSERLRRRSDRPSFASSRPSFAHKQAHANPSSASLDLGAPGTLSPLAGAELALHPLGSVETLAINDGTNPTKGTDPEPEISARMQTFDVSEPVSPALRRRMRLRGRVQFAALCLALFLQGWQDGTPGPLLPTIQRVYHVNFSVVSLIFVFNCIGYISGAIANVWLMDKLGFGKTMLIGAVCTIVAFSAQAPGPPFPVLVAAYSLNGFGFSILNAGANGFVGCLKEHVSTKLSFIHASYGVGAFAAPLAATHFAAQRRWSFHFLLSLGIALVNTIVIASVYRGKRMERLMQEAGQEADPADAADRGRNVYRAMFNMKIIHLFAIWALVYVGTEVTLGGWIVTFIIERRGGGASSGYISSGFFGGIALGRIVLIGLNRLLGEGRALVLYATLSIGLEVTVWIVPSLVENAVAVSFIGLLFGPMYPILMNTVSKMLPRWLLPGCIGWVAGVGVAGSAILPSITGVLAGQFGISSLQPFLVSMMVLLLCMWVVIPKGGHRRTD